MGVMAARVHYARELAFVFSCYGGLERQVILFSDGQRVHVGAHGDYRTGLAATQNADYTGVGYTSANLIAQFLQMLRDKRGSTGFAIAQLRVLVYITTPCDDLVFQCDDG